MVFYVTEDGNVEHESNVYCYKGKYWTKEQLITEAVKDGIILKKWGFNQAVE